MRSFFQALILSLVTIMFLGVYQNCGRNPNMVVLDPGSTIIVPDGGTHIDTSQTKCSSGNSSTDSSQCLRTKITGAAYCVDYQNGIVSNNYTNWTWMCGDGTSQKPSTWVYIGDASAQGCENGSTQTPNHAALSATGEIRGFYCTKETMDPVGLNEITGVFYCAMNTASGGCVAGSAFRVGEVSSEGVCTNGTKILTRRGLAGEEIGFACAKGGFNNKNLNAQQPNWGQYVTGFAYCGEGANGSCSSSSWYHVGSILTGNPSYGGCVGGSTRDSSHDSLNAKNELVGYNCQKRFFSLATAGVIAGVAYCAEYNGANKSGCGGIGTSDPTTWIVLGTATLNGTYCSSGTSKVGAMMGRGGLVGYFCSRTQPL